MKQKEKLDLILKRLYQNRHTKNSYLSIYAILQELCIYESDEEARTLATRLKDDHMVDAISTRGGVELKITSYGIDYCEEDSYSHAGIPAVALNYTIHGNAVFGDNNSNISQRISYGQESQELLRKIAEGIDSSAELSESQKTQALECVGDIEEKLQAQKKVSAYQWSNLLNCTANIAQVTSFALQLAGMNGFTAAY